MTADDAYATFRHSPDGFEKRGIPQNNQEDVENHCPKTRTHSLDFTKSLELGVFFRDLSIAAATRHPADCAISAFLPDGEGAILDRSFHGFVD